LRDAGGGKPEAGSRERKRLPLAGEDKSVDVVDVVDEMEVASYGRG